MTTETEACRVCGWEDYWPICPSCKIDEERDQLRDVIRDAEDDGLITESEAVSLLAHLDGGAEAATVHGWLRDRARSNR